MKRQAWSKRVVVDLAGIDDPVDTLTEQLVLGALMIPVYRDALWSLSMQLSVELFAVPAHRIIFTAIMRLLQSEGTPDVPAVLNACRELGGDVSQEYISRLWADAIQAMPILDIALENLERYRQRRMLLTQARSLVSSAIDPREDPAERAQEVVGSLLSLRGGSRPSVASAVSALTAVVDEIVTRQPLQYPGVRVGYDSLDRRTGGYTIGGLHVIAARPGMGKTALALQMSSQVPRYTPDAVQLFISLEMSRDDIMRRILSQATGISSSRMLLGELTQGERETIAMASRNPAAWLRRFVVWDEPISADEVANIARWVRLAYGKLDIVFVDYLGLLLDSDSSATNTVERIERQTRTLKQVAMSLEVPIVLLAQLNRLPTTRKNATPVLSDLRGSGSIEQDADTVLFIHRDSYYNEQSNPKTDGGQNSAPQSAFLILAKNRRGPTGAVAVTWSPEDMRFIDAPEVAQQGDSVRSPRDGGSGGDAGTLLWGDAE